jgi:hypothetical protein
MKRTNLLIHIVNCFLILQFFRVVISKSRFTAFLVAILFATHPIHTEAICGIVSRADLVNGFIFLTVGILYFTKYSEEGRKE